MVDNDDIVASNAICNWMSYIGASYQNLQKLKIDYRDDGMPTDYIGALGTLNLAMTNLNQINSFSINFNP